MKKFILIILFMILIYSVGGIYYIKYVYKDNNEPVVKNLAEIEGYPYSLKSNASKLYKDEFNILKDNLENNYNEDGSVTVPEVLRPYMGGLEKIEK